MQLLYGLARGPLVWFAVIVFIAGIVYRVVQFLSLFIAGKPNVFLTNFGRSLGLWLGETARFQSAATDERPFPWAAWPDGR